MVIVATSMEIVVDTITPTKDTTTTNMQISDTDQILQCLGRILVSDHKVHQIERDGY